MTPAPELPSRTGPRVLIVDNEQSVAALLLDTLAHLKIQAEWIPDGRKVAARVQELGARVVVCDLDMPGFSGEQVVDSLATLERPPRVLVISGFFLPEVGERLRSIPWVVDLLVKPFDVLRFGRRVQTLLEVDGQGLRALRDSGTEADGASLA